MKLLGGASGLAVAALELFFNKTHDAAASSVFVQLPAVAGPEGQISIELQWQTKLPYICGLDGRGMQA